MFVRDVHTGRSDGMLPRQPSPLAPPRSSLIPLHPRPRKNHPKRRPYNANPARACSNNAPRSANVRSTGNWAMPMRRRMIST